MGNPNDDARRIHSNAETRIANRKLSQKDITEIDVLNQIESTVGYPILDTYERGGYYVLIVEAGGKAFDITISENEASLDEVKSLVSS